MKEPPGRSLRWGRDGGSSDHLWKEFKGRLTLIGDYRRSQRRAENTQEGGLEDVDGVTGDSAEEDNGREGLWMSL